MTNQVNAEVRGIFDEAFARYSQGEKTYGIFDKDKDPRDFLKEAEEELLDVIVYAAFEIARIRALNAALNRALGGLSRELTPCLKEARGRLKTTPAEIIKDIDEPYFEPFPISVSGDDSI